MLEVIGELIEFQLESSAHWRRELALEYPDDKRNLDAAERLDRLATEVRNLGNAQDDDLLTDRLGGDDGFFTETLSEMARTVGFSYFPASGEDFVRDLKRYLSIRYGSEGTENSLDLPALSLSTVVTLGPKGSSGRTVEMICVPWFEIIAFISKDPQAIFDIPPGKWEEIIAGAYKRAGFDEVILTPRSADLGRDIIAEKRGLGTVRIIDQVKAYRPAHRVTANDVRALVGVLHGDGAAKGFLTTTSDFAPKLKEDPLLLPFMPSRLELINGTLLRERLMELAGISG